MAENYYIITDSNSHMPIRCTMQRFDHIRQQMHNYFELSMVVSGSCSLQMEEHIYSLKVMTCSVSIHLPCTNCTA